MQLAYTNIELSSWHNILFNRGRFSKGLPLTGPISTSYDNYPCYARRKMGIERSHDALHLSSTYALNATNRPLSEVTAMSKYTAPQRTLNKRSLSRRARIILVAGLLLPVSLLAMTKVPVGATASNNPIFATLQDVQNAINTALSPIRSAIAGLQSEQASQPSKLAAYRIPAAPNLYYSTQTTKRLAYWLITTTTTTRSTLKHSTNSLT